MTCILRELYAFLQPHKSGLHGIVSMRWCRSNIQIIHMSEKDVTKAAQAVSISSGEISDIFLCLKYHGIRLYEGFPYQTGKFNLEADLPEVLG